MTENELQWVIKSWENISVVIRHISDHPEHLDLLMKIAFDDGPAENWRAAWMIDKIHDQHPELILPYLPAMTHFLLATKNSGKKRHLLKLISLNDIQQENMALLLNYGIETFTDAAEPIAVRVHAMQMLYNITQKEPDLSGELIELIEREMEYHGSAGLASRGKKLLKKLYATVTKQKQAE
jgi:hypothetical protein